MAKLKFKKASFDIVWSEGAVSSIGLLNAIKMWRGWLINIGFMVIHDQITDYQTKPAAADGGGYELLHHFIIPAVHWFDLYFKPLEEHINVLK